MSTTNRVRSTDHLATDTCIFVVDSDEYTKRAVESLAALLDVHFVCFSNGLDFLNRHDRAQGGCLVLDLKMPGISGLELQQRMKVESILLPLIFVSGHADVRIAVEVMSQGALTLLEKPFQLDELLRYLRQALDMDAEKRRITEHQAKNQLAFARLTLKEREVYDHVVSGKSNKETAICLGLSVRAVEDRRARVMRKLGAKSVVELLHIRVD